MQTKLDKAFKIIVDISNRKVTIPQAISWYVTDENIAHLNCQIIDEVEDSIIDIQSYKLSMRVLTPSRVLKEVNYTLSDATNNIFTLTLPDELITEKGRHQCELSIEYLGDKLTSEPFNYNIIQSIANQLDSTISKDSHYPLVLELEDKLKEWNNILDEQVSKVIILDNDVRNAEKTRQANENNRIQAEQLREQEFDGMRTEMTAHKNEVSEELEGFSGEIESINSQLAHIGNNCIYISSFPKNKGEESDLPRINRAISTIPDEGGVLIFENKKYTVSSSININKDNVKMIGNGATIEITNQTSSTPIFFIHKSNNFLITNFELSSASQDPVSSLTQGINIRRAKNITIENIKFTGLTFAIKVDTDKTNVDVKNLITNNLICENGVMFIHMSCCDGWQGYNLNADLGLSNTTNLDHGFYIKPYVRNVQLSNVTIKNTNGHAIQFNRYDQGEITTEWGIDEAINKNFIINNLTVEKVNSPIMLNSEVDGLTVSNLIVNSTNATTNKSHWGLINLFQSISSNILITNVITRGSYCLITCTENNLKAENIKFSNINFISEFLFNTVNLYNIDSLEVTDMYINDIKDNMTSMFASFNNCNVTFKNLKILIKSLDRTTDIMRLIGTSNIVLDNCDCTIENKGDNAKEIQLVNRYDDTEITGILTNIRTKNITHIYKNFTAISSFLVKDGVVQ